MKKQRRNKKSLRIRREYALEILESTKLDDNLSRRNNRIKREIQNIKNNLMGKKKKHGKINNLYK